MQKRSIRSFISQFDAGVFTSSNVEIQTEAGWRKWLCADEDLCMKTQALGNSLKEIVRADSGKNIDPDNMYSIFQNVQPETGPSFDQISICDIQTGRVILQVIPKGRKGRAELWTAENKFEMPVVCSTWDNVLRCLRNSFFGEYKRP